MSPGLMLVAAVALAGCAGAAAEPEIPPAPPTEAAEVAVDPDTEALLAANGAAALGLLGLTGDEARRRLGPPGVLRHERWAEFWRYRLEPCVLDLYLYREAADRQRVLYAELRRDRRPARPDDCWDSVLPVGGRRGV